MRVVLEAVTSAGSRICPFRRPRNLTLQAFRKRFIFTPFINPLDMLFPLPTGQISEPCTLLEAG